MATNYWTIAVIALIVAIITFGIPLILAEVFPWRSLWKQRYGKPPVVTKSYNGRTVLITGANGAFGSRASKIVGLRDVDTLIMVDLMDCATVKKQIEDELKDLNKPIPNIVVWQIDMMSFKGCQELGKKARELKSLDHVLLTAGILSFARKESPEGWETCKHKTISTEIAHEGLTLVQQYRSTSFPAHSSGYSCFQCSNPPQETQTLQS